MTEAKKSTRREITEAVFGSIAFATLTGCMSAKPEYTQPTVTPVATRRAVEAAPESTEPLTSLPAKYDKIIAQAEIMTKEFPQAFAEAATLKDDLLELQKLGRLEITPIPSGNPQIRILATVRPQVSSSNRLLENIYPKLFVSPEFFTLLPPIEQVMTLTHELGHYRKQVTLLENLIPDLKGKSMTAEVESKIDGVIRQIAPQEESRELFKNCAQLFAIRQRSPNFKISPFVPWEQPLPNSIDRTKTLYSVYLEVRSLPEPENDPRWKAAIQNFVI